jgi:hypothetical protein
MPIINNDSQEKTKMIFIGDALLASASITSFIVYVLRENR